MWWVWQDPTTVFWGSLFSPLGGGHKIFSRAYISQPALQLYDQVTKFWPMGCKKCFTLFAAFHLGLFVPCLELGRASGALGRSWALRLPSNKNILARITYLWIFTQERAIE